MHAVAKMQHASKEVVKDSLPLATQVSTANKQCEKECGCTHINPNVTQSEFQQGCESILKQHPYSKMLQYYYDVCCATSYINETQLKRNLVYPLFQDGFFDEGLQITVNRARPEVIQKHNLEEHKKERLSQPKLFAGKCLICFENVASDWKPGLRVWEFTLNDRPFFLQFPPFPYMNRHSVIVEKEHRPQVIELITIQDVMGLSEMMPGLSVASNTDKLGTGATNLEHRHYQAGLYEFPVFRASVMKSFGAKDGVTLDWLRHPCAALRLTSTNKKSIESVADKLLKSWKTGSYPTLTTDLQTVCMIGRFNPESGLYTLILIPRNGENPRFLTRPALHCIKQEFLGIFEMTGYAIFPGRLGDQLPKVESAIQSLASSPSSTPKLRMEGDMEHFNEWIEMFVQPQIDAAVTKGTFAAASVNAAVMVEEAMYRAFVLMLQDNSPFPYNDANIMELWLGQAGFL